jgi:hypothetical protein
MSDKITITPDFSDAYRKNKWMQTYVGKMIVSLVNGVSLALQKHIRVDLFQPYPGGTTASSLSTRSGKLKKSVVNIPAKLENDEVHGGIAIGSAYARVHFGKRGQTTTITPKIAGALAIPLPAAMDGHGNVKGGPRDKAIWGNTFLNINQKGNAIIYGQALYVKGKKAGEVKGRPVPLFILKKSVTIPARIYQEDLFDYVQPMLDKGMQDIKNGLIGSTVMGD